jgi:hypothetical protein
MATTRTLNPLHFEDLEPHRFEDLVRQLAYDFRAWRSLQAIGRLGADEGVDVSGYEIANDGQTGDDGESASTPDRHWMIQCKREKKLGPANLKNVVKAAIPHGNVAPYGFVIAAACDFTLKARTAFRDAAIKAGVKEVHIWGKAEIEDMLFLPKHDHLLFAYFNISLQISKRTNRSLIRSRVATKRELIAKVIGLDRTIRIVPPVFIRDASDTAYPDETRVLNFSEHPRWFYATCIEHYPPDHLLFVLSSHLAFLDEQREKWDAIYEYSEPAALPAEVTIRLKSPQTDCNADHYHALWTSKTTERTRATLVIAKAIPYDRIVAVDEVGDSRNPGPHLYVDYVGDCGPYTEEEYSYIERWDLGFRYRAEPSPSTRINVFNDSSQPAPGPIPPTASS